jgi:prevent-host-death family protein
MQTLPISAAKSRLSELVDTAQLTREQYTITVNGSPAAMLVSVEEWESLKETLFWLSQAGIQASVAQSRE